MSPASSEHLPTRFAGRTVVVTGGGSGIGKAIAVRLACEGAEVVVLELREDGAAGTLARIAAGGGKARALVCDMADTGSARAAFAGLGRLDVLVNNAGIAHIGNVLTTSAGDLDRLYSSIT